MKISIVFTYPVLGEPYDSYALRFVNSYVENPPGMDHETIVVTNGGRQNEKMCNIIECFGDFKNLRWFYHDNSGKDIGGYRHVARESNSDLLVYFGVSTTFSRPNWLVRVAESFEKYGDTLYGTMAGGSVLSQRVYPHIRTTGFWTTPALMNKYPWPVVTNNDRYEFEHRKNCFTMWCFRHKIFPRIVTWDAEYKMKDWEHIPDGFHRSDQSGLLFKDRLAEEPYYTEKRTHTSKPKHEANSDILSLPVLSRAAAAIS